MLLGTEVRLTGLLFPESSFCPLLKMGVMFLLFQSVGTSPDCHDFSNMMDSSFATSCAVPSGSADAPHQVPWTCAPSGSSDGLKPDLFLQWVVLHYPSPCLSPSATWVVWLERLLVKTEAKKSLSTLAFSISCVTKSPISLQRGPTFPLVFLLSLTYL